MSVVFSTNKTDGLDIAEILLKVALNTNPLTNYIVFALTFTTNLNKQKNTVQQKVKYVLS